MLKKTNKPVAEGMHVGTMKGYQPEEDKLLFHVTYKLGDYEYTVTLKAKVSEGKTMSQLDVWQENMDTYHWDSDPYKALDHIIKEQIPLNLEKKGNYPLDLKKKDYQPKSEDVAPVIKKRA